MSPAHVLEPTYRRLKKALMAGEWQGGAKLEAMRIAAELGVSMTPVRDSLNQLVGEGHVALVPGQGFHVPYMTERKLRDMLTVHRQLIETGLGSDWVPPPADSSEKEDEGDTYPDRLHAVFHKLAAGSGNDERTRIVTALSERMHHARRLESKIVGEAGSTLALLEACITADAKSRHDAVQRYHEITLEAVPDIVRLMDR